MLAVAEALKAHGMIDSAIKFELFASAQPGRAKKRAAKRRQRLLRARNARQRLFSMAWHAKSRSIKKHESVLEAALAAKMDAPFACKGGVCSTCRAKLIEGEVDMDANYALEDYEVERGYILTCQSHPRTDKIIVDYDQ